MNVFVRLLTTHLSEFHLALSTQGLVFPEKLPGYRQRNISRSHSTHGFLLFEGKGKQS